MSSSDNYDFASQQDALMARLQQQAELAKQARMAAQQKMMDDKSAAAKNESVMAPFKFFPPPPSSGTTRVRPTRSLFDEFFPAQPVPNVPNGPRGIVSAPTTIDFKTPDYTGKTFDEEFNKGGKSRRRRGNNAKRSKKAKR